MGTASRNSSTSRSRSPREQPGSQGYNIPEMFRSGRGNMASSHQRLPQSQTPSLMGTPSASPQAISSDREDTRDAPLPHLNINDLKTIAADIKDTLSAAISELRLDIHALTDRVRAVEKMTERHDTQLQKTTRHVDTHTLQMRDMQRHLEDLDNRGRRHNLRVRGLPETIEGEQLLPSITDLFNKLLNRPPQTHIEMERFHRALRPKGRDTDPPRDIVCCIVDFKLKEEILRRARMNSQIIHEGKQVQIYQDLSGITLQHRRDLRPLLDTLRTQGISYKWKFPFCLSATSRGHTALLKVPEDLPRFCDILNIPLIDVPNWYADFRHSAVRKEPPAEEPMEAQASRHQRRRSPSATGNRHDSRGTYRSTNPFSSPSSRRARRY